MKDLINVLNVKWREVLHKKGLLVCVLRDAELLKKESMKERFKIFEERGIVHGKEILKVIVFGK